MRINSSLVILCALPLCSLGWWSQAALGIDTTLTTIRSVDGIADNSFLVEEAYKQEPGVLQHIFTAFRNFDSAGADTRNWNLAFTEEWPLFSQKHQVSYTVSYYFTDTRGSTVDGVGDVLLNYRYQFCYDERTLTAYAPRLSLMLPTRDALRGGGEETLGDQINLPFSAAIGNEWFVHLNAGATSLPDAALANGRDLWCYSLGASAIYAATPDVHFLVEWIGLWSESPQSNGGLGSVFALLISSGFCKAL